MNLYSDNILIDGDAPVVLNDMKQTCDLLRLPPAQRLDLGADRPESQHPGGNHNDPRCCSLHLAGCHVPHHVQKGRSTNMLLLLVLFAFLFCSILNLLCLRPRQVHAMYRTTGASFEKAQQEFATGVMSNKTVQTAAANAASRAAQGSFKEQI